MTRPRSCPVRATLFALCTVFLAHTAQAADGGEAFLFQWDNDKVVDTDRHYTNGMRVAYSFEPSSDPWRTTGRTLADLGWFSDRSALRTGWTFGQDMYTPENVLTYTPDPTDRPYAGWTYFGLSTQNETANAQDTLEFNVGFVGPAAHAGKIQNGFHRLINVPVSHGWRSQINNEPGLLATRTVKRRSNAHTLYEPLGLETDIIGHGTAQLGNVRTGAGFGATMRLGGNLREDFGPVYGTFALPHQRPDQLTYAFYIGAEARAVARDIFLDGNTFADSPSVNKNPFVMEGRIGFSIHTPLPDTWRISGLRININMVNRTREFAAQDKSDRYGSFQLTLNY